MSPIEKNTNKNVLINLTRSKFFVLLQSQIDYSNRVDWSTCGRGEIGRRARLRIWCRKAWGFESLRPYK